MRYQCSVGNVPGWLLLWVVVVLFCGCLNVPERGGGSGTEFLTASVVVPAHPAEVQSRLSDPELYDDLFEPVYQRDTLFPGTLFHVADFDHPIFPSQSELLRCSRNMDSLHTYSRLDPKLKKWDLALRNGIYYWHSEYSVRGSAVPFRCEFVLHLEEAEGGSTKVEILQFDSIVLAGEKFMIQDTHGVPGFAPDYQCVDPSAQATETLLQLISAGFSA